MNNLNKFKKALPALSIAAILALTATNSFAHENRHSRHSRRSHHHHRDHDRTVIVPNNSIRIIIGGTPYFYFGGKFCKRHHDKYIVVSAPIGAVIHSLPFGCSKIIINGTVYYHYDDTYYLKRSHGYVVVEKPEHMFERGHKNTHWGDSDDARTSSDNEFTINVPNKNGTYTPVTIVKSAKGYIGPQGELYKEFPDVGQLTEMYGNKS